MVLQAVQRKFLKIPTVSQDLEKKLKNNNSITVSSPSTYLYLLNKIIDLNDTESYRPLERHFNL